MNMERVHQVAYPAWRSQPDGDGLAVFYSLQVDAKATDPFAGAEFRTEVEQSKQALPGRGLNGRAFFFQLLTTEELRVLLARQNEVINSLPKPPRSHIEQYPEGLVRKTYLGYFERQVSFDAVNCWLRYYTDADVCVWSELLGSLVSPLVKRAASILHPDERYLGRGFLLTAS
jgi:hypothetical protein